MTETIKGGAYKGADGTWHDANGKPLPAHVIQQLEEQERVREAAQAQPEAEVPAMPAAHFVAPAAPLPVAAESEFLAEGLKQEVEPLPKPKRTTRRAKGGA